ncbi:MAG: FG-GAP-like repeat-containing protein [Planctomycetota bacterium]|nr:FG-GAP-like repeat-containing protein [Planctomycetota bacterium]
MKRRLTASAGLAPAFLALFLGACRNEGSTMPEGLTREPLRARQRGAATNFIRHAPETCGIVAGNVLRPENTLPYVYNGAGVAVGDVDADGLPDVYLVCQDGPNRLYRQTEPFRFEDVTERAGVDGGDAWGSGCTMVDFDGDGDLDIYVANTESPNLLYRNRGDRTFEDCARDVGLAHVGASTMPAFADYDNDGDLDLYLATNRVFLQSLLPELLDAATLPRAVQKSIRAMAPPMPRRLVADDGNKLEVPPGYEDHLFAFADRLFFAGQADRLFRNDGGRFADVTGTSGISDQGLGLSATWWDYDDDGWLDLYVANDLESPDKLYRNRGDGTFEDVSATALPHIAYFGMGADFADLDQDGRFDFLVADMAMRTHYKAKVLMGDMGDRGWFLEHGNPPQIMRNALFLNSGAGRFWECAPMAKVSNTNWTWSLKFGDLDNDGAEDLFVTNGIPRFDNDPDAQIRFRALWDAGRRKEAIDLARSLPPVRERNLALHNDGPTPGSPPKFSDRSAAYGLDLEGVSQGASFADFDGDGDLDLIVSNLNEPPALYENRTGAERRSIVVRLAGRGTNRHGIGARLTAYVGGRRLERLVTLQGGYLSTDEAIVHFGLGDAERVDSLAVRWPSGFEQTFGQLDAGFRYTIAEPDPDGAVPTSRAQALPRFRDVTDRLGLGFTHEERAFDDFAVQSLLPHRHSKLGPGLARGDVDGDGRDDLYIGGARGQAGALFVSGGDAWRRVEGPWAEHGEREDQAALLFDADGDGDLDLFVASGTSEVPAGDASLRDRLYRNEGPDGFRHDEDALPPYADASGPAAAVDFDGDGDLDLFVGGRVVPGRYPETPPSRLYRNDGGRFTDVTEEIAPELRRAGMVTGAAFADLDDDGDQDLVVTARWQPVRMFRNDGGSFVLAGAEAGFAARPGWWNGVAIGDVDGDQDLDIVTTNQGLNTKYKASPDHPTELFARDFDANGTLDVIEAKYEGDTLLPVRGRSCSSRAMPFLAEQFPTYDQFARASLDEIYADRGLEEADHLVATELAHVLWRNQGDGTFAPEPLPRLAQISPAFGVAIADLDGDGFQDVVLAQNFDSNEPETGRMAGGLSLWLRGSPDGLTPVPAHESGIVIGGDAKALLADDVDGDGVPDLVITQNDGPVRVLGQRGDGGQWLGVRLTGPNGNPTGVGARIEIQLESGKRAIAEVGAGGSYLAQSGATRWFGLGQDGARSISVRWPDGRVTEHPVDAAALDGSRVVTLTRR